MRTNKQLNARECRAKLHAIEAALESLKRARGLLRECGAAKAAESVARAIKSAEGAQRHTGMHLLNAPRT